MSARADDPIRAKCFHPSGNFIEFPRSDLDTSIPRRFEKIVKLHSDRIAVSMRDRALTYEQLNKMANSIARAIILQVGASRQPIALVLDPGIEAVAAIMAALKVGKCYVPLEPSFPPSRIRSILEDSQADLVITATEAGSVVADGIGTGVRVLNVDDCARGPGENIEACVSPDTLSFILYTSGSTGQPKGVLHTHRTALHAVMLATNLVHVCAEDRVALPLSHSFSASIRYLLGPLLSGATLLPFDLKKDGVAALVEWLEQQAITGCAFTGSMFRQFLAQLTDTRRNYPSLRFCFVGSESVSKNDVDLYKINLPDHTILAVNMGLNEAGSIRNLLIDKSTVISGSIVPVGYAVDDKEIILLSDSGEDVGLDTAGEIVVKSEYLSPGYWRQPELTAAKFIIDESSGKKRSYLTGDLGRMTADNCLYYLGRKDLTVKIRGYKVETPKVEMALLGHPGVKQAAVVPRQSRAGDMNLTAYIVPMSSSQAPLSRDQLRYFLKETLPDYMIPSSYVELEALPFTLTGKVDRKALPEPSDTRPQLDVRYVPPGSETEKELIEIWESVLHIRPIGVRDNFFDLGGHSLSASQIISRVFQRFQFRMPLQTIFQSATVADMAVIITEYQGKQLDEENLANILHEIESLSDAYAAQFVNERLREDSKKSK